MAANGSVMIADDHPIFRRGLRQFISDYSDWHVVGEAADRQTAQNLIHSLNPQIAILDIEMPRIEGLNLIRQVREQHVKTSFMVLTASKDEGAFNEALHLGVKAYVLKEDSTDYILQSLQAVQDGRLFISPSISDLVLVRNQRRQQLEDAKPSLKDLTPMERRVLRLIAENKTSKMIARELFISPYTVETHRCNICAKLDLRGTQPVLRFALEHRHDL